ncbi:hypothetical protein JOC37_001307 [Desulfohalotomaculum tongense]|uniref:hypothetical protein n=1 Tax=Desulforadius tongensis TaxID=1216062 RepID=UPI0019584A2E|nr:hypothetical protein [Desulforadius tongensis]MBM7854927.1 hypothetical protein [Desulforadius tongensis]
MQNKKMFRLNEDGVAEWIIAKNKKQALEYADSLWGGVVDDYYKEFLECNPGATFEEFVDYFVQEEPLNREFTLVKDNNYVKS